MKYSITFEDTAAGVVVSHDLPENPTPEEFTAAGRVLAQVYESFEGLPVQAVGRKEGGKL